MTMQGRLCHGTALWQLDASRKPMKKSLRQDRRDFFAHFFRTAKQTSVTYSSGSWVSCGLTW